MTKIEKLSQALWEKSGKLKRAIVREHKLKAQVRELEEFLDIHHYPVSGWKKHFDEWKKKNT